MDFQKTTFFYHLTFIGLSLLSSGSFGESTKIIDNRVAKENSITHQAMGIGALGRIEPRTRVIHVSHNAGPEGAKVEQLFFQEGDVVKKNQTLAILSDHDKRQSEIEVIKANLTVLSAKLNTAKITDTFNEKEYRRYQALSKTSAASASVADQKHLAFQQSQAAIAELNAQIASTKADLKVAAANLANAVINAPMDGTVIKIHTRPGERVPDEGVLEMADLTQLDVVAEVYEADLPKVHVGQKVDIRLIGLPDPYQAEVREIGFQVKKNDLNDTDPLADKDNRIIEVRSTLENKAVQDLQHQIYRQVQVRIIP